MGDTSRCLVWTGDLIDMEKASFSENLYVRLGESPGTRVLYTSSSHFSFTRNDLLDLACSSVSTTDQSTGWCLDPGTIL
jgi:hypothetical protein